MPDRALVELITRRVVNRLTTDQACSGCALRSCDAGNRACDAVTEQQQIPVGVSARHAHVTQEHLEILYGTGHQLTVYAPLYQPEAFAANETLTIVGKRMRAIEAVRILGPVRDYSQVESRSNRSNPARVKSSYSRLRRPCWGGTHYSHRARGKCLFRGRGYLRYTAYPHDTERC